MRLICYPVDGAMPRIVPAKPDRAWMDESPDRQPYRCLPLAIANAHGWMVLCDSDLVLSWNGGMRAADVIVRSSSPHWSATTHFGLGTVTFHVGAILRTEPGINLWVGGPPNAPKDGITALTGIVETDWLGFTFTMNWRFTRPGTVRFARDEPFCFLFPVPRTLLEETEPEIRSLDSDPDLAVQYAAARTSRANFNTGLERGEADGVRMQWQRTYFRGERPDNEAGPEDHRTKVRARPFVDKR
jgi:hypothetical protein